jgi:uncharacterized protein YggE
MGDRSRRWIAALFMIAGLPLAAGADDAPDRALITVTGEAEVRVAPDEAVLTARVVTLDKNLAIAKSRNDEGVKAVLAAVREVGVKPDHVQTGALAIDARESMRDSDKPLFLGYEVTKRLTIVLKDLARADDLLAAVVEAGVNRVDAFELRHSNPRKYKDEARALAIRAAREKAVALTAEIGQTVGKAFTITEDVPVSIVSRSASYNSFTAYGGSGGSDDSSFATGQNTISARVTVSFELP